MALRAESHGKPFTDFLTDCVGMNAVDLNIILVSKFGMTISKLLFSGAEMEADRSTAIGDYIINNHCE